jgi:hypothetical protein
MIGIRLWRTCRRRRQIETDSGGDSEMADRVPEPSPMFFPRVRREKFALGSMKATPVAREVVWY